MKRYSFLLGISLMISATMLMTACKKDDTTSAGGSEGSGDTTSFCWVDLGLPSGLLWANCNLGAQKPEDFGDHFAWGETSTKEVYSWDTYIYGSSNYELTKYCGMPLYGLYDYSDSLTTLEAFDDAAVVNLGDGARMPTREEWQELKDHTSSSWITRNGVKGCLLTASNGNSIFLPTAGTCEDSTQYYMGNYGSYWSSSVVTDAPCYAWYFNIYPYSSHNAIELGYRCYGLSVRAVRAGQN